MSVEIKISKVLEPIKMIMMDTAMKAAFRRMSGKANISCKIGCCYCCGRYTRISAAEAMVIYEYLKHNDLWTQVRERAQAQFELIKQIEPLSWFKSNIKCPVLDPDTKRCLAYTIRPPICAVHFVTSNPKICDPWSCEHGRIENYDFIDLYTEFHERLSHSLEGYGVFSLELPIPAALLFSEKISVQSGLDIQQALSLIYNEL